MIGEQLQVTQVQGRVALGTIRQTDADTIVSDPPSLITTLRPFLVGRGDVSAEQVMDSIRGWSNGYLAIHPPQG